MMRPSSQSSQNRGSLTRDQLEARIRSGEIDTVLTVFPDMYGRLVGKRITGHFFLSETADHGMHACDYLLACDMDMDPVPGYRFASWADGYGDIHCVPDLTTLRRASWLDHTALVLCDVFDEEREALVEVAPRTVLKRQMERAAALGTSRRRGRGKAADVGDAPRGAGIDAGVVPAAVVVFGRFGLGRGRRLGAVPPAVAGEEARARGDRLPVVPHGEEHQMPRVVGSRLRVLVPRCELRPPASYFTLTFILTPHSECRILPNQTHRPTGKGTAMPTAPGMQEYSAVRPPTRPARRTTSGAANR